MNDADDSNESDASGRSLIRDLWRHPWGRTLVIAITVAVVSWAVRETAFVTQPVLAALGSILLPLAIGFTIAYILAPLVDGLGRVGIPRLLGTAFLFLCFSLGLVLLVSLLVPALVRQGADLAQRTVNQFHYVDVDEDGRFSPSDVRVMPAPKQPGVFFEDRNGDGEHDPGEPRFDSRFAVVALESSLISKVGDWFDTRAGAVRRFVGIDLDQDAVRALAFYGNELAEFQRALDSGLAAAQQGASRESWPPLLRLVEADPEAEPRPLAWPGVDEATVRAAAEQLPEALRALWLARMQEVANRYHARHDAVLLAIARSRGANGVDDELVQRLRVVVREPLTSEARERATLLLQRLRTSEGQPGGEWAARPLTQLRGGQEPGGDVLRDMANRIDGAVGDQLGGVADAIGGWVKRVLSNIPGLLAFGLDVVLVPIYAFFLTLGMPRLRRGVRDLVPDRGRDRILHILHAIERVVAAFFRGRLIVCAICALLVYFGFLFLAVPYAVLFGLAIGLATAIPLAGLLFLVPAVLLTVVDGGGDLPLRVALMVGVYVVVQTLEATVFTPLIMGKEVELHPVTLIVALLFFGHLFGILGLILAVPIAATLRILFREFVLPRMRRDRTPPSATPDPQPVADPAPAP